MVQFRLLCCYQPYRGYWNSIYLGKAGYGKTTNLRARILEELKDERCSVWMAVFNKEKLHAIRDRIHSGRYEREWERGMKKAGTTHIVWVPKPGIAPENITLVEADLIESLYPTANRQRLTPPNTVQREAIQIFEGFRQAIHAGRSDRFNVSLAPE